ncbi:MAG: hypothetical protein H6667_04275 [Ardenticatenaceae bacterium]|nr:hypothetical protein [Ardenticatenaceae bacterium]
MNIKHMLNKYTLLALFGLAAVLLLSFGRGAMADDYSLPPRGTEPIIVPDANTDPIHYDGARLQVHALFSQSWPWDELNWQNVWTVIEWYDGQDTWYPVAGWQGNLDAIAQGDAGWVGTKEWWVGKENLGTGPFRWQIYEYPGGPLLVTSEPFNLPDAAGKTLILQPVLEAE